jgi:hypothetical protein
MHLHMSDNHYYPPCLKLNKHETNAIVSETDLKCK